MKRFATLYRELDASTATREKQAALQRYLQDATAADAAWAVYFLAGGKPRQTVPTRQLRELARDLTGLPEWLFEESYQTVGDLAETVSLLLPPARDPLQRGLAEWLVQHLLPLRGQAPELQAQTLRAQWAVLPDDQRFVYFKLITGGFRVGVSRLQVTQALAAVAGVDAKRVAQRLMGYTATGRQPSAADYLALIAPESDADSLPAQNGQPYPFFLAHPFNEPVEQFDQLLGPPADWQIEWKWDGIRAQLVKRAGQVWLWSRGEELVTDRFPELAAAGRGAARRHGARRRNPGVARRAASALRRPAEAHRPQNRRTEAAARAAGGAAGLRPARTRRRGLARTPAARAPRGAGRLAVVAEPPAAAHQRSAEWHELAASWPACAKQARERGTEGFMLKQCESRYGVGRTKAAGTWWKWKIDPMSVDAVLIYAQRGHGRRASVYSDYTFAVWDAPADHTDRKLVPFAKAYSGLTDAEMAKVDAVVRQTTVESFGPVRSVRPTLVFELGFEGISRSPRHKSGIAVRFPRMLRWREDKPVAEADTLQTLSLLLPANAT